MKKFVCAFVLLLIFGFASVLVLMSFIFPDFDPCENFVIQEVRSTDGQLKAVIFERDAGATTDFSTQVSIVTVGALLPSKKGNVFIIDGNHGAAPSGRGGGPNVWGKWINPKQLEIVYDKRAAIFEKVTNYQGISIIYKPK